MDVSVDVDVDMDMDATKIKLMRSSVLNNLGQREIIQLMVMVMVTVMVMVMLAAEMDRTTMVETGRVLIRGLGIEIMTKIGN